MRQLKLLSISLLLLFVSACNSANTRSTEPPRPTVVQVTPTFTTVPAATLPPATATPTPTPAPQIETEPATATESPVVADPTATNPAAPPTPTPAPSPTPTLAPPSPTPGPTQRPPLDSLQVRLQPVASGFEQPVYISTAGDGPGRLFVVEQAGRIQILQDGSINPEPFLDIRSLVGTFGMEQGLLSVAFHPDYKNNGYFFIDYTDREGDTVIARYSVSENPDVANPDSAKILLTIDQPYQNHNGGHLLFGPDGYLYVGMGDGGSANDPENRAQNLGTLLGKILRLDVDNADPYGVPPNNPFVNTPNARPEIWSYGWRNPWRMAFDPLTNDMYVADVGQNKYEEIDMEPAGSPGGLNYGWRLMEGFHCFNPAECDPSTLDVVLPVTEYDHSQGCSVTGGFVYRGHDYPDLEGVYFYSDYCSGIVWGLRAEADGSWSQARLLESGARVTSFGQDESGEVYLVDQQGTIYRVAN